VRYLILYSKEEPTYWDPSFNRSLRAYKERPYPLGYSVPIYIILHIKRRV